VHEAPARHVIGRDDAGRDVDLHVGRSHLGVIQHEVRRVVVTDIEDEFSRERQLDAAACTRYHEELRGHTAHRARGLACILSTNKPVFKVGTMRPPR
jgi:hypothetical protein